MATNTKIAILPTYTINNIVKPLTESLASKGINATVKLGGFQECNTDLLGKESWLAEFKPDFIVIPLSVRTMLPDLFVGITEKSYSLDIALKQLRTLFSSIENSSHNTNIILTTIEQPLGSPLSYRDVCADVGVAKIIRAANDEILAFAKKHPIVSIFDFNTFVAQFGASRLTDEKMWYLGSMLLTPPATNALAAQLAAMIGARYGASKKCIVVDLDNTLWGGVIGEDGVASLQLGHGTKIGDIFSAIQQTLLAYMRQGVLLAIVSKNNESDVLPVFESEHMILKKNDFAAMRINWNPKSENIKSIAKELNIGLDSLVFLDDNPAERLEVSSALPQVTVIDFPNDVAQLPSQLRQLDCFARDVTTKEDLERAKMYIDDKKRKELETSTTSLHDYLSALKIRIDVKKNDLASLARVTQLINKTNQFNLRTRRYTESEVKTLMQSPDSFVCSVCVQDSFGDLGLTGVAICTRDKSAASGNSPANSSVWFIDSFLLSCRILARDIELQLFQEVLAYLPSGAKQLRAEYIPTPKNEQVESFYEKLSFPCTEKSAEHKLYIAQVSALQKAAVPWIEVHRDN